MLVSLYWKKMKEKATFEECDRMKSAYESTVRDHVMMIRTLFRQRVTFGRKSVEEIVQPEYSPQSNASHYDEVEKLSPLRNISS